MLFLTKRCLLLLACFIGMTPHLLCTQDKRVIKGHEAQMHQRKFFVKIEGKAAWHDRPDYANFKNHCGGTIISEHAVLTNGHCFYSPNGKGFDPEFKVVHYRMKPNTEKHKSDDHRKVEKGLVITRDVVFGDTRTNVFFHPNFEIPLSGHHLTKVDLAMIVFKNKEFHKDQILELCPKTKKWANLFMIGMGVTKIRDGTSYPKWPQEKKVKEVKDDQCPKIIDKQMFLCLYPPDNSGAGDSGGPIFRAKTQAVNGKIEEDKAECLVAVDTSTYHAVRLESNQIREWIDITKEEHEHLNYDITKVNRIDEPFRRVVLKEN